MARTLIGQLILRLTDDVSAKAKQAAASLRGVTQAVDQINKRGSRGADVLARSFNNLNEQAKKLASAPWGHAFQAKLERLGASAGEIDKIGASWRKLQTDIASQGMTKALAKSNIAAWRNATLMELSKVRRGIRETEAAARRFGRNFREALKPLYAAAGLGTGAYVTGRLGAAGLTATSEREREIFRQQMAGLPVVDQMALQSRAKGLSSQYRSVDATTVMELGRAAMPFMGTPERGLQVLEAMTKGLVVLQSAKGVDAANSEMIGLVRGIDNLGKNDAGQLGVDNVTSIIDGIIKAVQIEGKDFDARTLFQFARRAKIAGPGLSTDFIMTTAPALMQDMTPEGFGTALSSAYQAYVIGSNAVASKGNLAEQRRLGLREGEDKGTLVNSKQFAENPYAWVKANLIPALQKDGIDLNDETAVAEAIAKTSRNTLATGMLTRMVTQQQQIDQLITAYSKAMGSEAAGQVAEKDPFASWEGLLASLRNLSATVGEAVMPVIVPGLNMLSDGINAVSNALGSLPPWLIGAGAVGGGAAGIFGLIKGGQFITGLVSLGTAGPALNVAAANLNVAAARLAGGAAVGGLGGAGAGAAGAAGGWFARARGFLGRAGAWGMAALLGYEAADYLATPGDGTSVPKRKYTQRNGIARGDVEDGAMDKAKRESVNAHVDTSSIDNAGTKATTTGQTIQESLNVTVRPVVDTSSIDAAAAKIQSLRSQLSGMGSLAPLPGRAAASMRSNFADHEVTP